MHLAGLLVERGHLDEAEKILRAHADTDAHAAVQLAALLAERGDLDGLSTRADGGDGFAADQVVELLAERGDLDGLRARIDAGDLAAGLRLPDLLVEQGCGEEAQRLRWFGLNPDGSIAWE